MHERWVDSVLPKYVEFTKSLEILVESLIRLERVEYLSVSGRTKTRSTILEKLERKKYSDPRRQLTDISGIRIVTFLESGVSAASKVISKTFEIDKSNSLDKSQLLGVDRIGYRSVHFVCSLTDHRLELPEFKEFKELIFEVQIRTVLQHAWAELAHDRQYKFSGVLPKDITRRLHLYAATLELADSGFQALANEIDAYTRKVREDTISGNLEIELTSTSLSAYLQRLPQRKTLLSFDDVSSPGDFEILVSELQAFGITLLKEIDDLITDEFIKAFKDNRSYVTQLGFLRDVMMFADFKKYFEDAWQCNWSINSFEILNFLACKYDKSKVESTLEKHGIKLVKNNFGDVINGIGRPIFDATWSSLKAQYHAGLQDAELKQEQIKAKQAIEQASKNYYQNYLAQQCNIKALPGLMKAGMSLDTIYTAVKFLKDSDLRYFSTLDDLEELYRKTGNRRFRVGEDERQDGLEVANQEQYLMVLGGPGVGKSTFLRKLGLDALEGRLAHDLMPVFIELKSFKNQDMSLLQAIAGEFRNSGFPYSKKLVESMLSDGKMLVLLDGLDEVPSTQVDTVIEQIKDFCNQYRQNYFVVSCQFPAYKGGFSQFTDVTIAEFDDEQIQQFIQNWFSLEIDMESSIAQKFWEILQRSENASAKELARTPLLLTFLCLIYDRSQSLPTVRSTLYGTALDILLNGWAAAKRIERDPIYQGFHPALEKELLSEIAYQSFKDDQLFFSEQEITDRIAVFLSDTLDAPKHLNGTAVLNAIEIQQGILVERAPNVYSFSHLTLQEYLTARYISKSNLMQEMVDQHLTDDRWREIFLLVSGLLEERSHELWLLMEQQADAFISSLKLQGLLQWAMNLSDASQPKNQKLPSQALLLDSASGIAGAIVIAINISNGSIIRAFNRARIIAGDIYTVSDSEGTNAMHRAFRASDIARTFTIVNKIGRASDIAFEAAFKIDKDSDITNNTAIVSLSTRAIARASDIARASTFDYDALSKKLEGLKEKIPLKGLIPSSEVASGEIWQNLANELIETFLTFFHLDKELITLSLAEAEALEKYLRAIKLIIDCKNAAVRVSRKEWEAIESRLLTVPGGGE